MKRTFTRTQFIEDLTNTTFKLYLYHSPKHVSVIPEHVIEYTGVKSWDLISGGEEAKQVESETDSSNYDEYKEYLVLHFEDGSSATFRNSHVDLFIR